MARSVLEVSGIAGAAVAAWWLGAPLQVVALASASAVFIAVARPWQCRHAEPGLLPPMTESDGKRVPARWYCSKCGHTWAAAIESEHRPVLRFKGYDESKAVASARRADQLERQQRGLAVKRAGIDTATGPRRARVDVTSGVIAIDRGRRMAK